MKEGCVTGTKKVKGSQYLLLFPRRGPVPNESLCSLLQMRQIYLGVLQPSQLWPGPQVVLWQCLGIKLEN